MRLHKDLGLPQELRRPATSVGSLEEVYSVLDQFAAAVATKDVNGLAQDYQATAITADI